MNHRDRLNEKTRKGCDSRASTVIWRGRNNKTPRLQVDVGHESNSTQDPVLSWVTERLGVAMRQAEDIILRDFLLSSVSVYNCKGGTDGDNPTEITVKDLSNVASALDTSNAFKFLSGKIGEDRFGSSPIRSAYFLLCSTELQPAFDAMKGDFTSSWNYPMNAWDSEISPDYRETLKAA